MTLGASTLLSVPLRTVDSRPFIREPSQRKSLCEDKEAVLLTHNKNPRGFIAKYDEGLESLHSDEVERVGRKIFEERFMVPPGEEGDIDTCIVDILRGANYIYWSLGAFADLVETNSSINMPAAMAYYLINDQEKPFYSLSPSFHFSQDGFLAEYGTMFARFAGATIMIVCRNKIPIRVESRKTERDYLLLPNDQEVRACLGEYSEYSLESNFYTDFGIKMRGKVDELGRDNVFFIGEIYDQNLIVIPYPESGTLPEQVKVAVECLDPVAKSIPRLVRERTNGKVLGLNQHEHTSSENGIGIGIDLPRSGVRKKVLQKTPSESIGLSLRDLCSVSALKGLSQAFDRAVKDSSSITTQFNGLGLKLVGAPRAVFSYESLLGSTHTNPAGPIQYHVIKGSGFIPKSLLDLQHVFNQTTEDKANCLIVLRGDKRAALMVDDSSTAHLFDAMGEYSQANP